MWVGVGFLLIFDKEWGLRFLKGVEPFEADLKMKKCARK